MPRIRTIKPQFFLNEDIAGLAFEWRLLFVGLWTQADREGRLEDRPARLKAMLFPYDDLDVNEGLGCLANAGLITRYDTEGLRLVCIPTWAKHQQPHVREPQSELPPPLTGKPGAGPSPAAQEGKGREGNKEGVHHALRARFDRFWAEYPKKVGKDAAWREWQKRKPSPELTDAMIAAVAQQRTSPAWTKDGGQYVPHPRTWLSQGRWEDEIVPGGLSAPSFQRHREPWVCPHLVECPSERICANATACHKPRKSQQVAAS